MRASIRLEFHRAFVDRRQESRTTLATVLEKYKETGVTGLKSAVQARSQVDQLLRMLIPGEAAHQNEMMSPVVTE